ncbi:MAG: hypothetical protein CMI81_02775 [Candidatus Pelagibacter sp.]|nr:hypothetical protein [Candidatus Pelagibacter sp.]OUV97340.1 MAG: hypothetical protein CBD02_03420 [Candidatus Pelagibacter sp. TMED142]|tara:strand:- start:544 stop:1005 length:462 start_codon:yes stop_codon:yes gene_type:complete
MSEIDEILKKLKIIIPNPPAPVGNYVAYNLIGNIIYISGQLPIDNNGKLIKGEINNELDLSKGYEAAKLCMLNALGHLKKAVGNLDRVNKCIKIIGYINANENFEKHPIILNAASDLLVNIFGERGKHARAVVGVKSLPLGATLEIESLFEIN